MVSIINEIQFIDAFKSARPWVNWNYPDLEFDLDPNGYIRSLAPGMEAYTLVFTDLAGHYPKGQYVLLYDGEGTLRFWEDNDSKVISAEPGRIVLDLQSDHGAIFTLSDMNPENYIRNIRMIPAEFEALESLPTFHPDFLARWQHVDIIRFMDWMRANESPIERWEERTTPASFTQGGPAGVSVEYMVELANELDADPWFTMPTKADDDYVRRFAEYVKTHLNPHLTIYIEWSNETWNNVFPQYHYSVEQGRKLGFTGSDWDIQIKYHAHRAKQIFESWLEVFGSDERLVKVLGGFHHGGAYMAELMLYMQDLRHWDEIGGAAYVAFASLSSYNKYGSWGLFEYHDQDHATAYKYQAVLDWMQARR